MPKVYIPSAGHNDFTIAKQFGDLEFICPPGQSHFRISAIIKIIEERLLDIKQKDYLIMVGTNVVVSICLIEWLKKLGTCNMLIYHSKLNKYIKRKVKFDDEGLKEIYELQ